MAENTWLKAIEYVSLNARYVHIHVNLIDNFIEKHKPQNVPIYQSLSPFPLITFADQNDLLQYWFLADSMAFCFWGYPKKWTIEYQGNLYDGWWGLLASHQKALENGWDILDAKTLMHLNEKKMKELYDGKPEIPLLRQRLEIFQSIGHILVKKYNGQFRNFLDNSPDTAQELVTAIAGTFAGFDDKTTFNHKPVYFYKKAQLLVSDLVFLKAASIRSIDSLVGEADYKIPALLRSMGILEYSSQLGSIVDYRTELLEGSPMEVEIRASMLWVVHLMVEKLRAQGIDITASELDRKLWFMSQDKSLITYPYHLTKTIHY